MPIGNPDDANADYYDLDDVNDDANVAAPLHGEDFFDLDAAHAPKMPEGIRRHSAAWGSWVRGCRPEATTDVASDYCNLANSFDQMVARHGDTANRRCIDKSAGTGGCHGNTFTVALNTNL